MKRDLDIREDENLPEDYAAVLRELHDEVRNAQAQAAYALNIAKNTLYWRVGRLILDKQEDEKWGTKVVERLASDLKEMFPDMGWSRRNIYRMRRLAEFYPEEHLFVPQPVAQMPWGHLTAIFEAAGQNSSTINFYAERVIDGGLSRRNLKELLDSSAHERLGSALSNYKVTLIPEQSALVQESLYDPVTLGFLGLTSAAGELELEHRLVEQIQETMKHLGYGLSFVERQSRVSVGGDDFYIDLLFFNYLALCFTVVELKVEQYQAEFAGKMNLYLSAVDRQRRNPNLHNPTVGIILVPGRNNAVVEASLGESTPIAVVEYTLDALPALRTLMARKAEGNEEEEAETSLE